MMATIYIIFTNIYKQLHCIKYYKGFPGSSVAKNSPAMQELQEMLVRSLGQEDPLKEGMAIYSSILAWRIPQTAKSGGLQFTGSQRVGYD